VGGEIVTHINQSKKAINRIRKIAEQTSLKYEIVFPLISLFWNYDGEGSWTKYDKNGDEFISLSNEVISSLKIPGTFPPKDTLAEQLLHELKAREANQDTAYNRFLYASVE